jgi:hypothetical protein
MHNHGTLYELIEAIGPRPFVTRRTWQHPDGSRVVWHSRLHRKHLQQPAAAAPRLLAAALVRGLWMPQQLNWWIGVIFALGSALFMLGSVLSLAPQLARA